MLSPLDSFLPCLGQGCNKLHGTIKDFARLPHGIPQDFARLPHGISSGKLLEELALFSALGKLEVVHLFMGKLGMLKLEMVLFFMGRLGMLGKLAGVGSGVVSSIKEGCFGQPELEPLPHTPRGDPSCPRCGPT